MQSAHDWIRGAIGAHLTAQADALRAHALGVDADAAERRRVRARATLGTGEARERLEEAIATRALDDASQGALLAHLAGAAEAEVFSRRGVTTLIAVDTRVVVGDVERSLRELAMDARSAPAEVARVALAALLDHVGKGRSARLEAFAEASERRAKILARGPASPDATPAELAAECARFLDATEDATADLVARAHHAAQSPGGALVARARALTLPAFDAVAAPRKRTRRIGEVFRALDLDRELARRVSIEPGRLLEHASAHGGGRAVVLASGLELGLPSESALLGAVAAALTRALVSPTLPVEHAEPPTASAAEAIGRLFEGWFADAAFVARHFELSTRDAQIISTASAAALALAARHACTLVEPPAGDDSQRELAARALCLDPSDVPLELARPSIVTPLAAQTAARARLAALTYVPALRERYDVDLFRNPRLADFLRGAAARGGLATAESLRAELGADAGAAGRRVIELAERAAG